VWVEVWVEVRAEVWVEVWVEVRVEVWVEVWVEVRVEVRVQLTVWKKVLTTELPKDSKMEHQLAI
jgi:hypothetical protein